MGMNARAMAAALAAAVIGVGLGHKPAAAQDSPLPIKVKLGVLLPTDGDTKDFAGNTHFMGEVDLNIPLPGVGNTVLTAGYSQGSRGGRKLRVIPLTIAQVFSPPNPAAGLTGNVYFGVGVGAYLLRASGDGDTENKTTFGGFGVVGYQFPNAYFVEAKYHVAGDVAGLSPNGPAFLVGRKF